MLVFQLKIIRGPALIIQGNINTAHRTVMQSGDIGISFVFDIFSEYLVKSGKKFNFSQYRIAPVEREPINIPTRLIQVVFMIIILATDPEKIFMPVSDKRRKKLLFSRFLRIF